jgi:hypothetical protein
MEFCLALEETGRGIAVDGAGEPRGGGLFSRVGCVDGVGIEGEDAVVARAILLREKISE